MTQASDDAGDAFVRITNASYSLGIQGDRIATVAREGLVALEEFVGEHRTVQAENEELRGRVETIEDVAGAELSEVERWRVCFANSQSEDEGEETA